MSENFSRYLLDSWKFRTFPRLLKQRSSLCGNSMSCLSETSFISEAIPLLQKNTTMITYEAEASYYELVSIIGKGLNNAVIISSAHHVPSNHPVAVRRTNLDSSLEDITYIQNEILVTKQLRHENLISYYSTFVHQNEVWAIMPLIAYGSAKDIIYSHYTTGLPEMGIALIIRDVLSALDYIHKRGLIHRSVKASHILISSAGRAILTGLRYSCNVIHNGKWQNSIHSFPRDCMSNLNWLSPEVLEQNLLGYNANSDMYSLGITVCELANGVVPFDAMPPTQMLLEKLQGFPPRLFDAHTLLMGEDDDISLDQSFENSYRQKNFSQSFHIFTELCLQREPNNRPSATQLLNHPFIKQCKKMNLGLHEILGAATPIAFQPTGAKGDITSSIEQVNFESLTIDEPWVF